MPQLANTFTDSFSNTSISGFWTVFAGAGTNIFEQHGRIEIFTPTSSANTYYGMYAASFFDLTGNSMSIQLETPGDQTIVTYEWDFMADVDAANNRIYWKLITNKLQAWKAVAGSYAQVGADLSFNATIHKFLRLRESAGTTYWEWSTNGVDWTTHTSIANPITLTSVRPLLQAGTGSSEASTTMAGFDNYNLLPNHTFHNTPRYVKVGNGMSRSEGAT